MDMEVVSTLFHSLKAQKEVEKLRQLSYIRTLLQHYDPVLRLSNITSDEQGVHLLSVSVGPEHYNSQNQKLVVSGTCRLRLQSNVGAQY